MICFLNQLYGQCLLKLHLINKQNNQNNQNGVILEE